MAIITIVLLLAVTFFVLENQTPVTIQFLAWHYDTKLGLAMIAAAVVGAILIYITGFFRQRQEWELRTRIRGVETRLREVEQQQGPGDETKQPPNL